MEKEVTISAGQVLTLALLKKVNKAAYQFGGLKTKGGIIKKTAANLAAKTTVIIERAHIKGDVDRFLIEFNKTMNASYYSIEII